jgi:hypothetical protein
MPACPYKPARPFDSVFSSLFGQSPLPTRSKIYSAITFQSIPSPSQHVLPRILSTKGSSFYLVGSPKSCLAQFSPGNLPQATSHPSQTIGSSIPFKLSTTSCSFFHSSPSFSACFSISIKTVQRVQRKVLTLLMERWERYSFWNI